VQFLAGSPESLVMGEKNKKIRTVTSRNMRFLSGRLTGSRKILTPDPSSIRFRHNGVRSDFLLESWKVGCDHTFELMLLSMALNVSARPALIFLAGRKKAA
jgi:hypothetical protein